MNACIEESLKISEESLKISFTGNHVNYTHQVDQDFSVSPHRSPSPDYDDGAANVLENLKDQFHYQREVLEKAIADRDELAKRNEELVAENLRLKEQMKRMPQRRNSFRLAPTKHPQEETRSLTEIIGSWGLVGQSKPVATVASQTDDDGVATVANQTDDVHFPREEIADAQTDTAGSHEYEEILIAQKWIAKSRVAQLEAELEAAGASEEARSAEIASSLRQEQEALRAHVERMSQTLAQQDVTLALSQFSRGYYI